MPNPSLWGEFQLPAFPALDRTLDVDVVVVGGGVTGATCARELLSSGMSVALLERDRCGDKNTGHTTAHLTYVTDLRYVQLERTLGRDHAQAVWDSGIAALNEIGSLIETYQIDCDYRTVPGYLCARLEPKEDEIEELTAEMELINRSGFDAHFVSSVPVFHRPGICFPNQAKFHPRKYLAGLLQSLVCDGGHVFEQSEATEIESRPEGLWVWANGHLITCRHIVMATDVPLQGVTSLVGATLLQSLLALYSSYAIGARVAKGTIPSALFWDTSDPYYFLRLHEGPDHDVLVFGGCDHKTGQKDPEQEPYKVLEDMLKRFVPSAVTQWRWSGQVTESHDGLPLIGETSTRQYVATGFSGNGFTFGTLAGMMIRDAILKRSNPWAPLFAPGRGPGTGGIYNYITENLHYPYYMLKDRIASGEKMDPAELRPGEGRILIQNGKRVAAARDERGNLHIRSAVCTHMGCLVRWNEIERTWDCPCHGSRFDCAGNVLAGPAETPLAEMEEEEENGKASSRGDKRHEETKRQSAGGKSKNAGTPTR